MIVALLIGCIAGYGAGLSLKLQEKAPILAFLRFGSIALIGYLLLHWGTISFILFCGSMLITMWAAILK